ncbi:MAG: hypothetical protein R6X02_06360 [Enhygromyxa sp.]
MRKDLRMKNGIVSGLLGAGLLFVPLGCNDDISTGQDEVGGTNETGDSGDGEGDSGEGNDMEGDGDGDTTGDGDGDQTGDGDGDTTGDGDGDTTGDGDGDTTGDGDGDTGDGDGDTTGDGDGDGDTTGDGDGDTTGDGDGDESSCLNVGGDCCPANPGADAVLTGTVYAPNGTVPVSGAIVYTSDVVPDPIPDTVYCSECLELTCGLQDYSETAADGTFAVQAQSGNKYLVVQKGQFMRVTPIEVMAGNHQLADELTELPGEWDPANGLYMPKIAVGNGSYDRIEDALGKMGMADTMINNFEERTVPGTESFDLWDNGQNPIFDGFVSQGTFAELVSNPANLEQYHVIFVPCSSDTYISALNQQQNVENIRAWVEAGGRWYVADWSNEWLGQVFPEYQNFYTSFGSADLNAYDSLADVLDDGMITWLEALPDPLKDINPLNDEDHPTLFQLPQLQTVDNWSGIQYPLPELWVDDGQGDQVNVGHRAWLEGPGGGDIPFNDIHPLTVTAQYGCGKIQFTSYHTAEFFDYVGLSPQELVLMYTILEIGVCQADLPPPQ